jgi:hypothetical protein
MAACRRRRRTIPERYTEAVDETLFWKTIRRFDWKKLGDDDAVVKPAVDALASMSVTDIHRFEDIMAEKLYALDTEAHARHIGEDSYAGEDEYFSVDEFLYARCVVVVNGPRYFAKVLANPKLMPKDSEFEALLYVAGTAYRKKTGKEMRHHSKRSYETFSNKRGWRGR